MSVRDDLQQSEAVNIEEFYDFLYEQREGYVYVATKEWTDKGNIWKQNFFQWPAQRAELVQFTIFNRSRKDVYVAPAMYKEENAEKEGVLGANVVWADFDEQPKNTSGVPAPTCRVSSGGDGHEHWYWKLDTFLNPGQLEIVNKSLAYFLEADPSGWNCNKILRPPDTFNHKRKRETSLLLRSAEVLALAFFGNLPQPPTAVDVELPQYIPPVHEVIAKYEFPKQVRDLIFLPDPIDRSDALMSLGYHCAEMGMTQAEIVSMLVAADDRWLKFKGRDDRMVRIMEIVSIAITKYPPQLHQAPGSAELKPMGFKSVLNTEINLEWQWDGYLHTNGYMLLTGPTGVGKTQFSLNVAGHMALGKPFLERDVKPARIGFFSLEMGLDELKFFLQQMQHGFTPEEQDVLEEQLQFFVLGEPLYMSREDVRKQLDQIVGDLKLDGIMVDSLGSASEESLSDEKFKNFFHWNDNFRQRHNIFTWYIHHHRKANGDNRTPNKISDVYGNQYITSYATSVVCLWEAGIPNTLRFIELKKRLAPRDAPFLIARNSQLHYMRVKVVGAPSGPLTPLGGSPVPDTGAAVDLQQTATQGLVSGGRPPIAGGFNAWSMPHTEVTEINVDMGGLN